MSILQLKMIKEYLNNKGVRYDILRHDPVYTSEQAAKIRGVELKTGVKALIFQTDEGKYVMGLVAADKKIHLKKLSKIIKTKKLQLASPQDVQKITGCEVGSVHPFGNLHDLPTYMDISVLENESVNFNAGLHTVSIQMKAEHLKKVIRPIIENFSK